MAAQAFSRGLPVLDERGSARRKLASILVPDDPRRLLRRDGSDQSTQVLRSTLKNIDWHWGPSSLWVVLVAAAVTRHGITPDVNSTLESICTLEEWAACVCPYGPKCTARAQQTSLLLAPCEPPLSDGRGGPETVDSIL